MKNKMLKTIYLIFCSLVAVVYFVGVFYTFVARDNYNLWVEGILVGSSLILAVLMVFIRELLFYLDELEEKVKGLEDQSKDV